MIFMQTDSNRGNASFFTREPVLKTKNKSYFSFGVCIRDPVYGRKRGTETGNYVWDIGRRIETQQSVAGSGKEYGRLVN